MGTDKVTVGLLCRENKEVFSDTESCQTYMLTKIAGTEITVFHLISTGRHFEDDSNFGINIFTIVIIHTPFGILYPLSTISTSRIRAVAIVMGNNLKQDNLQTLVQDTCF